MPRHYLPEYLSHRVRTQPGWHSARSPTNCCRNAIQQRAAYAPEWPSENYLCRRQVPRTGTRFSLSPASADQAWKLLPAWQCKLRHGRCLSFGRQLAFLAFLKSPLQRRVRFLRSCFVAAFILYLAEALPRFSLRRIFPKCRGLPMPTTLFSPARFLRELCRERAET